MKSKNTENRNLPHTTHTVLQSIIYVVVVMLYSASMIALFVGIGLLVAVLIYGWVEIRDGRLFALGILTSMPLHYLKKYLESKGYSKLRKKEQIVS